MFVTSDIFDFPAITRFRRLDWRENLLGGIDVHGMRWPGYQAGAHFVIKASERCGLVQDMRYGGYGRVDEQRMRIIQPKSFDRLAQGKLSGARDAQSVFLEGERPALGTSNDNISFGGYAKYIDHQLGPTGTTDLDSSASRFRAGFVFPLDEEPIRLASDLFQLAVDILGADYGYHFVRDALCGPGLYAHGISAPLDYKHPSLDDAVEIRDWAGAVWQGEIWSSGGPMFRDLFQVNLLSQRHREAVVDGVGLLDWIAAQSGRGQLDDIGQGRRLWTLTDSEMVAMRPVLDAAGLLVSCRPRVYRDLPNGAPVAEA